MTTGQTWAAAQLKPTAVGPLPLPLPPAYPTGAEWEGGVNPGKPTPKGSPGTTSHSYPRKVPRLQPSLWFQAPKAPAPPVALGSRSSPPPGGARQPETQCGQWGLGSTGEHLFLKSSPSLGAAGGGAWTLTHRPLPSLGSPRPAETLHTGNNRNGREGKRARQTKAL